MKIFNTLFLLFAFFVTVHTNAQEGVAPLWGNDVLRSQNVDKRGAEATDNYIYEFLFDTNHLPIMDDFSKNYFKQYAYDTANTPTDTLIWQFFLVDGAYVERFKAMTDTSYYFSLVDTLNNIWDSVATPVVYVTHLSQIDYQMVTDTDTVWARQDTLIVGGSVIENHIPDIDYINKSDTVIRVSDIDTSIWRNNNVLHNYTYSDDPVTLGMATFDGLDSTGTPYDPTMNANSHQIADVLESKPIFLKTHPKGGEYNYLTDSIYLSFMYQPQGLGDAPEAIDSLVLQFYSPFTDSWYHMWSTPGTLVHPFRTVMVRVNNPIFFLDGFKFRFLNYASVSGNFDHWNIDYVRIAEDRTISDSTITDVGLMDPGYSLLEDYYQMPWSHYKNTTKSVMKTEQNIRYRNAGLLSYTAISQFNAYDNGAFIFSGSLGIDPQFGPLETGGRTSLFTDEYPKTSPDTVKSFNVEYLAEVNPDLNHDNDTAFFHQQFGTQYAYDDGSAEGAYYLVGSGAQIAVEYNIAILDSLRAINIYFPRSFENIIDRAYRIMVWKSLDPEVILHESYLEYPRYAGGRDLVQGYVLEEPIEVEGQIFVGIKQIEKKIYIGLDRNNDRQAKNFYNVGGRWTNSSYKGSLFIRPEFGTTNPFPVGVSAVATEGVEFKMYPNPANSSVTIESNSIDSRVIVRSILGVVVRDFEMSYYGTFDASNLPTGMYVVESIDLNTQKSSIKKLLIQH